MMKAFSLRNLGLEEIINAKLKLLKKLTQINLLQLKFETLL